MSMKVAEPRAGKSRCSCSCGKSAVTAVTTRLGFELVKIYAFISRKIAEQLLLAGKSCCSCSCGKGAIIRRLD